MDTVKALGSLVKREREKRGLRGTDLGAAIGRDAAYVSRLENSILKEIPDPATVRALAEALVIDEIRILEAIGYRVREPKPVVLPFDSDRAALMEMVPGLTEAQARAMIALARAFADEKERQNVANSPHQAVLAGA